jgi:glutathione synthase/RimK-type ligase-like ATP-grasp enzyme
MERIRPEVLIISNKFDYSTDHIAFQLNKFGASYLRLNRDQFSDFKISLFPTDQRLFGETDGLSFEITPPILKSIYFRAPVYLRDNYKPNLSLDEQLSRSQWAAFIRSLTVFENVLWVNHPQATYQAEIKPYQLYVARKIGFDVPNTIVTNTAYHWDIFEEKDELIIKTLDPIILEKDTQEAFIYTNTVGSEELLKSDISSAPVILQEALIPKIDVRVTVVGDAVFAVDIKQNGKDIDRDWRLEKDNVQYTAIDLPSEIRDRCIALVRALGLNFGGIDLVINDGKYFFLEINPTGEWAWLLEHTKLEIDKEIAELLLKGRTS